MPSGVRTRYHLAINGRGFILRGTPQAPAYIKEFVPTTAGQIAPSDYAYDELNGGGWKYYAQTDWTGGFQRLKWKDDGSFKDGQGIDTLKEIGSVLLQNNFTSAVSVSGSHTYGAHEVDNGNLILGTIKAGAAKVFKITSAHSVSTLSAMAGISAVNAVERWSDTTLIGMTRTSGTLKTLSKYTGGSTIVGVRATNSIVRAIRGFGTRVYVSEFVGALSGDQLGYATTVNGLSAITSAYNAGKNQKIRRIEDLVGNLYLFIEDGRTVYMFRWDESLERAFPVYTFPDLTNWGTVVMPSPSLLLITGTSNNKKVAYAFNGARVIEIFDDQLRDSTYDFTRPFIFEDRLHTKGALWDGENWFPGLYGKYATVQYTPFANFANRAYGFAVTGSLLKLAYLDTTKNQISGNVIGSNFGSQLGAVDKLVNAVTVGCKPLATGQMMEVYQSRNEGTSYTSIGTLKFSTDGAISGKTLYFPSGFVTKKWLYKVALVGPGTSTPTLQDIAFQYRPIPDTKRRWNLAIDAGDNVKLLNGQQEQRDGKALVSELWLEKEAKRTVTFEDVDAMSAKITSAMAAADTTARVNETRLFPPKGRLRVVSAGVVEEMTYTSAEGGLIKGLSRAQKGTKARAYPVNTQMDNYYTVLVTNLSERLNDTDEKKTESIAQVSLLEV